MQFSYPVDVHTSALPKALETEENLMSLRQHLHDVLEGGAFKSSPRCGQFLKYIIEQTIAGHGDSLKERLIGVELFGRSPSYDTGEDAIVRVTASDVRRRLLQHYGTYGSDADFRIALPQGSYVPEITHTPNGQKDAQGPIAASSSAPATEHAKPAPESQPAHEHTAVVAHTLGTREKVLLSGRIWLAAGLALTIANIALACGIFWTHRSATAHSPHLVLPWSAFFSSSHVTHLITSDPNVETAQDLCDHSISVSDYANHNYIPNTTGLSPEIVQSCRLILSADNASGVDPGIAARISAVAQQASATISVRSARNIELTDLKTDDNYIFLGSPRSNPWSALFNDQLDFRFVYDKALNQEFIRNVHPREHELAQYLPTALGGGTGKSFAIVAFLQNIDQNGQVLLLAGNDAEGTEAAGNFVTDLPRLSSALHNCGISGSQPHFELLLQLDTMAGSPNDISLIACHALSGSPAH